MPVLFLQFHKIDGMGTFGSLLNLKLDKLDVGAITEQVKHSWYEAATTGHQPSQGETRPQADKAGAYSWVKSPRYDGKVYEGGPLARLLVTYASGDPTVKQTVEWALKALGIGPDKAFSVLGRVLARALCTKLVADAMPAWLLELKPYFT